MSQPEPDMPADEEQTVHWAGPGQWRTNADKVQPGLSEDQDAAIDQAGQDGPPK